MRFFGPNCWACTHVSTRWSLGARGGDAGREAVPHELANTTTETAAKLAMLINERMLTWRSYHRVRT